MKTKPQLAICLILAIAFLTSIPSIVSGQEIDKSNLSLAPQRTRVLKTAGLAEAPRTIIWKSRKLFDHRARKLSGSDGMSSFTMTVFRDLVAPVAEQGRLYFSYVDTTGSLYVLDSTTGQMVVMLTFKTSGLSIPAVSGNVVFFGMESGQVRAYDVQKRSDLWIFESPGESFSEQPPVFDGKLLYVTGRSGGLYAIESDTGKLKWKHTAQPTLRAPAINGDRVIAVSSQGRLIAIDRDTGSAKWEVSIGPGASAPSILGQQIFLTLDGGEICSYSLLDGSLKWKSKHSGGSNTQLVLFNDTILYGAMSNSIAALDSLTGTPKSKFKTSKPCHDPIIAGDLLYVSCNDKKLYALEPGTLRERWVLENKKGSHPAPMFMDGVMYFVAVDGHMYAMK